ncbi:MAG: 3'-5' exonuclease domain-containing protein 2 [Burkholderiales bacterium]|nr:3'-5' exonuclease domain-containing protein 2 [Burkholderiales bacterium]
MSEARSLSPEALGALPIRRYEGPVRLVTAPAELERALAEIERERVVGFDTETRPAFVRGERYLPALVQLATAGAVYLLQVQQHDFSGPLREVLGSERVVKAGVSVREDLRGLRELFAFEARAVVDLGTVARRHGVKQTGVRNLAGMFLAARIPKGAKTTNWAARQLTPRQIAYAATDAWVCRELYLRFAELGLVPGAAPAT